MNKKDILAFFKKMEGKRALIIGDVMIDSYLWGKVERISPEAPVPVVSVQKRQERLGGAANVALNIQSLGAVPMLCSVIGNDLRGESFLNLLKNFNIDSSGIFTCSNRPTTTKFRIISQNHHHLLRVDEESVEPLPANERKKFKSSVLSIIRKQKPEVIIFQDYDKGCITPDLIKEVVELARTLKIPVSVDPKKRNFKEYKQVTLFKPNLKELTEGLKLDVVSDRTDALNKAVQYLDKLLAPEMVLITLSDKGIFYSNRNKKQEQGQIPAKVRQISDVSGAGDTVISCASLGLAVGLSLPVIAALSNIAGGIVCEYPGVVPIDKERLIEESVQWFSKIR